MQGFLMTYYLVYIFCATNIVPAGAPNVPNLDKITKNSVTLSWAKPSSDGGSKLTGYVVEKKKKGEDWMECATLPASQLTATIPNLGEGEEYQFRVRAENAAGSGEPSKPTNAVKIEDQPGIMCLSVYFLLSFCHVCD